MGIFSFLFSWRKNKKFERPKTHVPRKSGCIDGSQYIDMARENDDI